MKESIFFSQECRTFFGVIPSSFIEEGGGSFFMESRRFPSETEGEGDTLFACYDLFCHTPISSPTRLANPNRFRGAKPYTETPCYYYFFNYQQSFIIYK